MLASRIPGPRLAILLLLLAPLAWTGLVGAGEPRHGHGPFLGVQSEEETDYAEGGARITRVVPDSAAEKAGLQNGDIVVAVDGQTVHGPRGLAQRIGDHDPGDAISLTVVRDGRERTLDAELGEREGLVWSGCDEGDCPFSFHWDCTGDDCESFSFDLDDLRHGPMLGVQLAGVTDELREHLGGESGRGVLVSRVFPRTAAADGGIEVGDLIVAVDGRPVEGPGDIRRALEGTQGRTIDVDLVRDRRPTSVSVTIPERDTEPRGVPRAGLVAPRIDLSELRARVHEAMGARDEALRQVREALRRSRVSGRSL